VGTLKMGVIGLGMGRGHARGYHGHPRAELVAVCDPDEVRAREVQAELDVPRVYADAADMLKREDLDAVSIAVPNKLHAPLTIQALKKGLHVLCEKPMAMTVREAQRMQAAAEAAGRNLMINFSFRFTEAAFALKRQVEEGVVGDIYFGRSVWHRRRGIPRFGGWFGIQEMSGGGPLIDLGVHRLDLALWLMGYPEPVAVSGSTYDRIAAPLARREKKQFSVEDVACGLVKFANGATLILEASWALNQPEREHMITQLYGDRGGLAHKNINGGYEFVAEVYTDEGGDQFTKRLDWRTGTTPSSYHEFVDSVLDARPPLATGEEGVKVMKILEGIYKSAASGREVRYRA